MNDDKNFFVSPAVRTALSNFSSAIKMVPNKFSNKKRSLKADDEFEYSGSDPVPPEDRLEAAIKKFNAANELRIVAATNIFAELDNDFKLLQEYKAYKNFVSDDLIFTPISEDTLSASQKGKSIEIKCKVLDNGSKEHEIKFYDGSQINYVIFSKGSKMKINGEEFEMPVGTIHEVKSVNGRVFSQLIQTPNMLKNVVNMPEVIDNAELILKTYNPPQFS